jgi:Flp pilus assembly protein TadB
VDQHPDAPVSITTARASRSAEIKHRQNRYLLSMGIRTACFVGAVVTSGVLRWVLVAGAFFLPYIAVVMANA